MNYADVPRFERLTAGCKTPRERVLKLMEIAEKSIGVKVEENEQIKSLKSQVGKLLDDLKKQPQSKVEIREVPKIEYRDRIVEKPIYIEKPIYKGEKIVEKPIEKIVEKVIEKPVVVYVGDDDWLPKYWPFANQEEHDKWFNS
jgi:hypothetical protein